MYCRKCGREIPDDSVMCGYCGTPTNPDNPYTYGGTPQNMDCLLYTSPSPRDA